MLLITASGRKINLTAFKPEDVCIYDIAHSLSHQCRFGGHTQEFYSVAQHSVLVAMALPWELKMAGLLHDATEAYVVDLPRPLKELLPEYRAIEARVWEAIANKFDLPLQEDPLVKAMDDRALRTEWEEYVRHPLPDELQGLRKMELTHNALRPQEARDLFLRAFEVFGGNLR